MNRLRSSYGFSVLEQLISIGIGATIIALAFGVIYSTQKNKDTLNYKIDQKNLTEEFKKILASPEHCLEFFNNITFKTSPGYTGKNSQYQMFSLNRRRLNDKLLVNSFPEIKKIRPGAFYFRILPQLSSSQTLKIKSYLLSSKTSDNSWLNLKPEMIYLSAELDPETKQVIKCEEGSFAEETTSPEEDTNKRDVRGITSYLKTVIVEAGTHDWKNIQTHINGISIPGGATKTKTYFQLPEGKYLISMNFVLPYNFSTATEKSETKRNFRIVVRSNGKEERIIKTFAYTPAIAPAIKKTYRIFAPGGNTDHIITQGGDHTINRMVYYEVTKEDSLTRMFFEEAIESQTKTTHVLGVISFVRVE